MAASSSPGRASTKGSSSSVVTTSGGASRMRVRRDRVDDEAGVAGQRGDRRPTVAGERDGPQQPGAADAGDQRVAEGADRAASRCCAGLAGVLEQALALDGVEHGEPGGAGERVAAEGRAVLPGGEQRRDVGAEGRRARRSARRRRGPWRGSSRRARRPACWKANQSPVRPMPVWISSRTSSAPCVAGQLAGRAQVVGPPGSHPGLALDRLEDDGRRSRSSTAARRASASSTGT